VNPLSFDDDRPEVAGVRSSGGVLFVTSEGASSLGTTALPNSELHTGNLHALDIPLFTEYIRADALQRIAAHANLRVPA
jgi:hypothetical protein